MSFFSVFKNEAKTHLKLPDDLMHADVFPHAADNIKCIVTHISWVILAGDYAYKIKKPVNFGFLDFSTLEKRFSACEDELRINRRTAPEIYEGLTRISNTPVALDDDSQPTMEYAIRMHRFSQSALLPAVLETQPDALALINLLARHIADFHATADIAAHDSPYGTPESVLAPVQQNFRQLREKIDDPILLSDIAAIERWTQSTFTRLQPIFAERKANDHVRECHGDMHLGNIIVLEGKPLLFDALEFNASLRWIDVISDIAFLVMDLQLSGRPELGWHVLNQWLEHTGDYASLHLLPWYLCYRAMVRAKVAALRLSQLEGSARQSVLDQCHAYLALALSYTQPRQTALIMTHGISGSGKTTHSQYPVDHCGLIRIRADVERKRLFGLHATESSRDIAGGIYTKDANRLTQQHLKKLAHEVLSAGYPVLVDATFIRQGSRDEMKTVAQKLGVPWYFMAFEAKASTLRDRANVRCAQANDASEADATVVDNQLTGLEPLQADELARTLTIHTDNSPDWAMLLPTFRELTGIK